MEMRKFIGVVEKALLGALMSLMLFVAERRLRRRRNKPRG
jgi:hypothetical protein